MRAGTKKKFEVYVRRVKPIWMVISSALFSHVGLFFLNMLYAVLGAWIFLKIELPEEEKLHELKKNKSQNVASAILYLKKIWWEYANNMEAYNFSRETFQKTVHADLTSLKHFVVQYNSDYGYDGTDDWDYAWTFANSLLFTITIMSTIGYGHISPQTFTGRFFCIFYSLIGIGLLLVFMANIGDLMANAFKYLYSRCCCRWCRVRRKESEVDTPSVGGGQQTSLRSEEVGQEDYMPTNEVNVPIMVNLMLIGSFLLIGALVFSTWEDWSLSSSLYFCFVTLTTIGFGDMVPTKSFLHYKEGVYEAFKMIFTVLYCVFGMTLLSMCVSLMQEQVMDKVNWLMSEIGMNDSEESNDEIVKVTRPELENATPKAFTGNEADFNTRRKKSLD